MSVSKAWLALGVLLASGPGCSLVKDADDVVVGEGVVDSGVADSPDTPDAPSDLGVDAGRDTGEDALVDANDAADATDAPIVLDPRWALWPMPSPTPSSYDTSSPDVVVDNVTRLRWQKVAAPAKKNAVDAAAACAALSLGGTAGWRLPTRVELVSLLAFSPGTVPAINGARFLGTASAKHWTSSTTVRGAYVVDFSGGTIGFALETEVLDYRCVHSP